MPATSSPARIIVGGMSEVDVLKRNYQVLRVKYEKSEEKVAEFRDKLKDARLELGSKDRSLDVAKRMVQRIHTEKNDIELASEQGRVQVKKLEAKLYQASDPSDLLGRHTRLKAKFAEQKEQLMDMESRMMLAEETNLQLSQECHVLKGALGMKDGLSDGALGSQARLLHQLSKSQGESTSLAVQMAEGQRHMQELQDQLERAHREIGRLQESRAELDAQLDEARQHMSEAVETATVFRREAEQYRSDLSALQVAMEEMMASRMRTEQQLRTSEQHSALHQEKARQLAERLMSVERASRLSIETLRTEVTIAVERAESRASEQRAGWAVREASLTEQCLSLKRELEAVQHRAREDEQEHAAALDRTKQRAGEVEDELEHTRRAERERVIEIGRLHGQIDTLTELNRVLKCNLDAAEDKAIASVGHAGDMRASLEEEREVAVKLQAQVGALQAQLHGVTAEHNDQEGHLRDQVKALRTELALTTLAGDQVQAEVQAVRQQAAAASNHSGSMDAYVHELISTIESLTDSKQKLQTYMLEQVTVFKSKLQRAEDDNRQLRLTLAASKHGMAASPPRTGFRDASLAARVPVATSDAAALRASGDAYFSRPVSAGRASTGLSRRPAPTSALYERAREATRMEEDSDEDSAGAVAPRRPPDSIGQHVGTSGSRYQRPLR